MLQPRRGPLGVAERLATAADRLARYTGLSQRFILSANLRVDAARFRKELLRDKRLVVGRLDGRYTALDADAAGERQEFSRDKLNEGFRRALHKRPVPAALVDEAIDRIVHKVLALGEREITSRFIGELVMNELKRLDKVAYIRFASVYRAFQDVDDFRDLIREVDK